MFIKKGGLLFITYESIGYHKRGDGMNVKDIHVLMEQFFSDGFTAENLSKITGVSVKTIMRCANSEMLSKIVKKKHIRPFGIVDCCLSFFVCYFITHEQFPGI